MKKFFALFVIYLMCSLMFISSFALANYNGVVVSGSAVSNDAISDPGLIYLKSDKLHYVVLKNSTDGAVRLDPFDCNVVGDNKECSYMLSESNLTCTECKINLALGNSSDFYYPSSWVTKTFIYDKVAPSINYSLDDFVVDGEHKLFAILNVTDYASLEDDGLCSGVYSVGVLINGVVAYEQVLNGNYPCNYVKRVPLNVSSVSEGDVNFITVYASDVVGHQSEVNFEGVLDFTGPSISDSFDMYRVKYMGGNSEDLVCYDESDNLDKVDNHLYDDVCYLINSETKLNYIPVNALNSYRGVLFKVSIDDPNLNISSVYADFSSLGKVMSDKLSKSKVRPVIANLVGVSKYDFYFYLDEFWTDDEEFDITVYASDNEGNSVFKRLINTIPKAESKIDVSYFGRPNVNCVKDKCYYKSGFNEFDILINTGQVSTFYNSDVLIDATFIGGDLVRVSGCDDQKDGSWKCVANVYIDKENYSARLGLSSFSYDDFGYALPSVYKEFYLDDVPPEFLRIDGTSIDSLEDKYDKTYVNTKYVDELQDGSLYLNLGKLIKNSNLDDFVVGNKSVIAKQGLRDFVRYTVNGKETYDVCPTSNDVVNLKFKVKENNLGLRFRVKTNDLLSSDYVLGNCERTSGGNYECSVELKNFVGGALDYLTFELVDVADNTYFVDYPFKTCVLESSNKPSLITSVKAKQVGAIDSRIASRVPVKTYFNLDINYGSGSDFSKTIVRVGDVDCHIYDVTDSKVGIDNSGSEDYLFYNEFSWSSDSEYDSSNENIDYSSFNDYVGSIGDKPNAYVFNVLSGNPLLNVLVGGKDLPSNFESRDFKLVCDVEFFVTDGDTYYAEPEVEHIVTDVNFFNNPVGDFDESSKKLLDDIKAQVDDISDQIDTWDSVSQVLEIACHILDVLAKLQSILNMVKSLAYPGFLIFAIFNPSAASTGWNALDSAITPISKALSMSFMYNGGNQKQGFKSTGVGAAFSIFTLMCTIEQCKFYDFSYYGQCLSGLMAEGGASALGGVKGVGSVGSTCGQVFGDISGWNSLSATIDGYKINEIKEKLSKTPEDIKKERDKIESELTEKQNKLKSAGDDNSKKKLVIEINKLENKLVSLDAESIGVIAANKMLSGCKKTNSCTLDDYKKASNLYTNSKSDYEKEVAKTKKDLDSFKRELESTGDLAAEETNLEESLKSPELKLSDLDKSIYSDEKSLVTAKIKALNAAKKELKDCSPYCTNADYESAYKSYLHSIETSENKVLSNVNSRIDENLGINKVGSFSSFDLYSSNIVPFSFNTNNLLGDSFGISNSGDLFFNPSYKSGLNFEESSLDDLSFKYNMLDSNIFVYNPSNVNFKFGVFKISSESTDTSKVVKSYTDEELEEIHSNYLSALAELDVAEAKLIDLNKKSRSGLTKKSVDFINGLGDDDRNLMIYPDVLNKLTNSGKYTSTEIITRLKEYDKIVHGLKKGIVRGDDGISRTSDIHYDNLDLANRYIDGDFSYDEVKSIIAQKQKLHEDYGGKYDELPDDVVLYLSTHGGVDSYLSDSAKKEYGRVNEGILSAGRFIKLKDGSIYELTLKDTLKTTNLGGTFVVGFGTPDYIIYKTVSNSDFIPSNLDDLKKYYDFKKVKPDPVFVYVVSENDLEGVGRNVPVYTGTSKSSFVRDKYLSKSQEGSGSTAVHNQKQWILNPYKSKYYDDFCPPAVIYNYKKERQVLCKYASCLIDSAKNGYDKTICQYDYAVDECLFVEGAESKLFGTGLISAFLGSLVDMAAQKSLDLFIDAGWTLLCDDYGIAGGAGNIFGKMAKGAATKGSTRFSPLGLADGARSVACGLKETLTTVQSLSSLTDVRWMTQWTTGNNIDEDLCESVDWDYLNQIYDSGINLDDDGNYNGEVMVDNEPVDLG